MPSIRWRLAALITTLDDQSLLARPLLPPGVSCLASTEKRWRQMLAQRVADVAKQIPPVDLHRYCIDKLPEVRAIEISVPPLRDDILRCADANLTLRYVVWSHADDALIAFVPALGIEVLAEDEAQLADLLEPQIKMALSRRGAMRSLRDLVDLARHGELQVRPLQVKFKLPTLKEAALEQERDAERGKSLLKEIGTDLRRQPSRPVYERDAEVERLAEILTRRTPRSVLLVGRSGVGKSALVAHLAQRAESLGLGGTPLWSTSGSRIVGGVTGFGMWQERCDELVGEAGRMKAIVHFGNLVELIEVGKGGGSLQGVAALLRPHLDRGAVLGIAECTPDQLAVVEREDPQLLETFVQFNLAPPSPEQTRAILRCVSLENSRGPRIPRASLATLDRLHARWAVYSAAPGRQLRFLRNLLADRRESDAAAISPGEVTAAFSHETGLPLFMLDDALPLDPGLTRAWFAKRVIGQSTAVEQVVDLLCAVKTGLTRPGKPIASLLFIGPTGVGKTEMAKSLAEFLYQDRGRMIRFDMSEYAHPSAVERLIGGAYTAQGLLTQKVRDQPFTVVLFDEFEKAHPLFFDVLLQVLGEGRLTDGIGRVTDFTNAVVIMTSNLGAQSYGRGTVGFSRDTSIAEQAQRHFEREVKAFLRPEMFNRLDRIVPFSPLDRPTIAAVARRELEQLEAREGILFRRVHLEIADDVVEHVAAIGFDTRYGARSLKRAIETQIAAPLADELNRHSGEVPLLCRANLDGARPRVAAFIQAAGRIADDNSSAAAAIQRVVALRRHVQALEQCSIIVGVRNEIERIKQAERALERKLKRRKQPPRFGFTATHARLSEREAMISRIDQLARDVATLEDGCLAEFYASQTLDAAEIETSREELERRFRELMFELPQVEGQRRTSLAIAAFGESMRTVAELMQVYGGICRSHGEEPRWFWLKMYQEKLDDAAIAPGSSRPAASAHRPVIRLLARQEGQEEGRKKVVDVFNPIAGPFHNIPSDCIGMAMEFRESRSVALLQTESGKHEFVGANGAKDVCLVEALPHRVMDYDPPRDIGRRGSLSDLRPRRTYNVGDAQCFDALLKRGIPMRARRVDEALRTAVEEYLAARLWEMIEPWS